MIRPPFEFFWISIVVGLGYIQAVRFRGQKNQSDVTHYIAAAWSFVAIYALVIAI